MIRRVLFPTLLIAVAVAAWFFVPLSFWHESKAAVLSALSVLAAAVLVRLARGLPFTNADHFLPLEIDQVATAIAAIARSLRALIIVLLLAMAGVVCADLINAAMKENVTPEQATTVARLISSLLSLLSVYSFIRVVEVVQGDVDLVDLQGKIMREAVRRKAIKNFSESQKALAPMEYKGSESYGNLLN